MFLAKLSINRPVMVTMFILVFVVFGLLAYFVLPLNLMPDVTIPVITVQTVYPGAGPLEIETQISRRIEDAVSTVSDIDVLQSYSMSNVSIVLLQFDLRKDIDIANQEVKDRVDRILNELPGNSERPIISKFDITERPIIDIVLTGPVTPIELYDLADLELRDRFSQIDGVTNVELRGGQKREIIVELNEKTVFSNYISLPQLSNIIAAYNIDMPAGHFTQGVLNQSVRLQGEFQSLEDLENIEIPTNFGVKKLHQLAEVRDGGEEIIEKTTYFNRDFGSTQDNVIRISLYKSPEGNIVDVAENALKELQVIRGELPAGVNVEVVNDDSIFIRDTVSDTVMNIILGILFTGIVLLFFLHDLRSTFIVALAMPVSIVSSIMFLNIFGFSLNMLTLMGFSSAVGILVVNSVVVLENIFRHKEMGQGRKESADIGTSEIATAVIASTLTNLVVFLPIANMTSMAGQFFKEFALTVTFATIFSLIISFTLTPMLASLILPNKPKKNRIGKKLDKNFKKMENGYGKMIGFVIKRKMNSIGLIGVSVLILIISFFFAMQVGFEFMPAMDEGDIVIDIELPEGYNLDETAMVLADIESSIVKNEEVSTILTNLGTMGMLSTGQNLARADIKLVNARDRAASTGEVANRIMRQLADVPNAKLKVEAGSSGPGGGAPIQFYLMGTDLNELERLNNVIIDEIIDVPGLINLDSSSRPGSPEITLRPKINNITRAGITVVELAMILRNSIEGNVSTQYRLEGNEYDVRVKLREDAYNCPEKIANLPIVTPTGVYKLSQLAETEYTTSQTMIMRRTKATAIEFTGSPAEGVPMGDVVRVIRERLGNIDLPPAYSFEWGGMSQMLDETITDMLFTFFLAILLTYMLLAAILESFIQPIFILATLPLALIGIFFILFFSGQTMNIISMMSIIMLVGIVVNNAILILDYTNLMVRGGKKLKDALLIACPTKLKPIIMSSLAIILGMLPMAMGLGAAGREFRQSMGIVTIGGIIASTILTLFVIPAVYSLIIKDKN